MERVYSVLCFAWRKPIQDRIRSWKTKATRRLFRFKRQRCETLTGYCTRTARAARTIWKKINLPFLTEMIADSLTCDTRPNAVLTTLKYAIARRSTAWWQNSQAKDMTGDSNNHTRRKHKFGWHHRGVCVEQDCFGVVRKRGLEEHQKRDFVTISLLSAHHSVIHRPNF